MNYPTLASGQYVRVLDDPFGKEVGRGEIVKIDPIDSRILLNDGQWYPDLFVEILPHPHHKAKALQVLEETFGTKHDEGKLRYDLLPVEALAEVVRGMTMGAKKYGDHNWRKGFKFSRNYAALQRHANEFWKGLDMDTVEEGKQQYHLAAVIFNALIMLQFTLEGRKELDDRYRN